MTQEFTVEGACSECMHMGWCLMNDDTKVQRCDTCSVFKDDDAAMAQALRCAAQALRKPRQRTGKRIKAVLTALEIAARDMNPEFWVGGFPNPEWVRWVVDELCLVFQGSADGAPALAIAYAMQDEGLIYSPDGEDVEVDYAWLRENLEHGELEAVLVGAGCRKTSDGYWRVEKKQVA